MGLSAIRHLAASYQGYICAAAMFECYITIWDIDKGKEISKFDSCIDFGGRRLAVSGDGDIVVAGSFERNCIEAYQSNEGRCLWQRKDLEKIQYVEFEPWSRYVIACLDNATCHLLDSQTGLTIKTYKKISGMATSSYHNNILALEKKSEVLIHEFLTESTGFSIEKETFAVLALAFSQDHIYISESGGSIRCFDLKGGSLLWRRTPPLGSHYLRLAYAEERKILFGVLWAFETGGNKKIHWIDPLTGNILGQLEIKEPAAETEFAANGQILITSDGELFDLSANQKPTILMRLNFIRQGT